MSDRDLLTFSGIPEWNYAYGRPLCTGQIKVAADDFIVEEILPFVPDGSGEHVFLRIEKVHQNTEYVARILARHAEVRQRDIGYAGLKDRHGRTTQWFSVWLPGKDVDNWSAVENDDIHILDISRHSRKLKRGVLKENRFVIRVRFIEGDSSSLSEKLVVIRDEGFPNYYGEQRFGHQGRNVEQAAAMFEGKKLKKELRPIILSAARSFLFNQILSERVGLNLWSSLVTGDVVKLDQSNSHFKSQIGDEDLEKRIRSHDVHPASVLWGTGLGQTSDQAADFEDQVINAYPVLAKGLEKEKLEKDYRSLRVVPANLNWMFENTETLLIRFSLPSGSYATSLLRELIVQKESFSP